MLRLCVACLVAASVFGQAAPSSPAFEVADIRVNTSGSSESHANLSNGRLILTNLPLRFLIAEAWTMTTDDIYGPSWLDDVHIDAIAKAPSPQTSDADLRLMAQTLLKDRMKMVAHIEQREKAVWALSVWKGQPKMTPSEPPAKPEDADCKWSPGDGSANRFICTHMTMAAFAHEMTDFAGRELYQRVVDQTGLRGVWDFTLDWTPQAQLEGKGGLTLSAALRAQLGLQLESRKLPVPVVVIDSMDRTPTGN
jgi:uncharacterized protein (TIGR03435 family)